VLDLGCGVGGPAREICRFSGAFITGVNNNAHQVGRAQTITRASGPYLAQHCDFTEANFMELPFGSGSYDHAYAIEATCHAPEPAACYAEIARCLKPGGMFVCYEWVRACAAAC
jgi:sterol 24-C-methyltransferase